jgi:outer membrane protein with beta-barrel domain
VPRPTHRVQLTPSLALAVFFTLIVGAGLATAQTVIVTHAPPNESVELVFNADRVQTATADANGEATLTFNLPPTLTEADVRVSAERCGNSRRVLLVERGLQTTPPAGPCDRRDVAGFFVVRPVTTFVVDMENPDPVVHIRQGPAPLSWLGRPGVSEDSGIQLPPAPQGLIVSAGAGIAATGASSIACGSVTDCTASDLNGGVSISAGYWISHIIGVEASIVRPSNPTAFGSGDGFHFTSARQTRLWTIAGMVGAPIGGVRIYGRGGAAFNRTTTTTTETVDISGTQNFELKTAGWGWLAGGGLEVWMKPFVAFYADGGVVKLQGNAVGGGEGSLDDQLMYVVVGARLHFGARQ